MDQKTSEWLFSFNSRAKVKESRATTVTITGGKGGVGKTSVSLKLAKSLSASKKKVLLIDCDYNLSNTSIKLGLPVTNSFYSLLSSEKSFEECLYKDKNFHLLSACNGSLELFDSHFKMEDFIIDIINAHEEEYDYILLDCPAGLSKESLILSSYTDHRIVVVTPDKASITDSYSLMKVLSMKYGIKENHLLVNMYHNENQLNKVVKTLSETVENFLNARTHILGGIPKIEGHHSGFDKSFLNEEENSFNKNFFKIVNKFADQLSRPSGNRNFYSQVQVHQMEQEVH